MSKDKGSDLNEKELWLLIAMFSDWARNGFDIKLFSGLEYLQEIDCWELDFLWYVGGLPYSLSHKIPPELVTSPGQMWDKLAHFRRLLSSEMEKSKGRL